MRAASAKAERRRATCLPRRNHAKAVHFFLTMQRCNDLTNHVAKPKVSSRKPKFDDP
jgi:hypothetical protein